MRALLGFLAVIALIVAGGSYAAKAIEPRRIEVPTVPVQRGELVIKAHTRGLLRAVQSTGVAAPNFGGSVAITQMAAIGATVGQDDPILAFDSTDQENLLETARSREDEAQQEINKNRADAAIREQQDRVDLLRAEFAVRRAELDVSRNEMVSEIDAQKNLLALEAAKKRLAQLQEDVKSRRASAAADLAVFRERFNRAGFERKRAEQRIAQTKVKAPMKGLVSIRQNQEASGGFFFPGLELPEFRTGDQVFGGAVVMEVVDTSEMEMAGAVYESERGKLREGQEVIIRFDSMSDVPIKGRVKTLAGMTSQAGVFSSSASKTFDVVFSVDSRDERLRPGMSGAVEVITERIQDAVSVPMQAVFEKDGKQWVYVPNNGRYERREVSVGRRGESRVEITKGLTGAERVAMIDPESRAATARKGSKSSSFGI
jgi:multidrug efflux pump subunit AcrA (membrane-fusion protein)